MQRIMEISFKYGIQELIGKNKSTCKSAFGSNTNWMGMHIWRMMLLII